MANTQDRVVRASKLPEEGAQAPSAPAATGARIVNGASRTIEVPLEFHVEFKGVVHDKLTVTRLTGADLMKLKSLARTASSVDDYEPILFSLMCQVDVEIIRALDADDLVNLMDLSADFMPRYVRMASELTAGAGQSSQQT